MKAKNEKKLVSPAGDIRAMRSNAADSFYTRKVKNAGPDGASVFTPAKKFEKAESCLILGSYPGSR